MTMLTMGLVGGAGGLCLNTTKIGQQCLPYSFFFFLPWLLSIFDVPTQHGLIEADEANYFLHADIVRQTRVGIISSSVNSMLPLAPQKRQLDITRSLTLALMALPVIYTCMHIIWTCVSVVVRCRWRPILLFLSSPSLFLLLLSFSGSFVVCRVACRPHSF